MSMPMRRSITVDGGTYVRRGDLVLWVSYVPDGNGYQANGMDSKQPALFIGHVKRDRVKADDNKAWCLPLSDAWRYATPEGDATTYLMQRTADIGNHIGVGDTLSARRQIWDAILSRLPDLLAAREFEMVKHERHRKVVIGEVNVLVAGQQVGGTELTR